MSLNHSAALIACRNLAATLQVATTGTLALAATTSGWTRASGSFITDGFKVGMEATPSGFATNTSRLIKEVAALTLTADATLTAEASAGSRSITVGLPEYRMYPNVSFNPKQAAGRLYTEEEWLRGTSRVETIGPRATMIHEPIYIHKFYGMAGKSAEAMDAYVDAFLALFAPGTPIATSASQTLTVKRVPAPFASQITNPSSLPGRALVTVTVPLWAQTQLPT